MLVAALELGVIMGIVGSQVVEAGRMKYFSEEQGLGCHVEPVRVVGSKRVVKVKRSMRLKKAQKQR
jgi:hypothetical protein